MNEPTISDYQLDVLIKLHLARTPYVRETFGVSPFEEWTILALQELQRMRATVQPTSAHHE